MAEPLSPQQVRKTAHLARILLTDDEVRLFAGQLGQILAYVEKLDELDTSAVEPLHHVLALTNVWRDDEVGPSLDAGAALREAPARQDGFFRVPKVLGDEGGA